MRVRVADPALLPDLVEFLRARIDAVVTEVADDELEVSLLGSYAGGPMRMELELRIRAWQVVRQGAMVEILD